MLRYKTETRPGLVALYVIRPGNVAGQFLQSRSPHGANRLDGGMAREPPPLDPPVALRTTNRLTLTTLTGLASLVELNRK